jgi:hypothetical protein
MAQRLGSALLPAIIVVVSSVGMWILLTIAAVALSQQPKIRRTLMKELANYESNAEAQAQARALADAGAERSPSPTSA